MENASLQWEFSCVILEKDNENDFISAEDRDVSNTEGRSQAVMGRKEGGKGDGKEWEHGRLRAAF